MATKQTEQRQIRAMWEGRQEDYEDLKESDPQEAERYAETFIEAHVASSDWPLLKDRESLEAVNEIMGVYGVQKEWKHCRKLIEERGPDAWPLLERQRDYFEEQIRKAEEELEHLPFATSQDPTATLEKKAAHKIGETVRYARMVFQRKLHVLRKIMRQWALTRHVPELTDEEAGAMAGASRHRKKQADKLCCALADYLEAGDGSHPHSESGEPFNGSLGVLYDWGTAHIEADGTKTVYRALLETGLLPLGNQGDSSRLPECLENMVEHAKNIQ